MLKSFWFIALFISTQALSCEMRLPALMVVVGEGSGTNIIQTRDCTENVGIDAYQIIRDVEGRITASQLTEMLAQKGHAIAHLEPQTLQVMQLRSLIRDQLQLPTGVQVRSTRGVNVPGIVALAPGDRMEVHCANCLYGAHQPLNIVINGFDGVNRTFNATADFRKMVRAYRSTVDINSFSSLDTNSGLKEEYVESIPHTDLVTDLEVLKFYKSNKPIKAGSLIKFSDLNAINLVKAGLKTDVIIENSLVRIKTQGISRNNGSLGDLVEVFHPQKNKKYQGKVVDINKVLVEL